MDKNVEFVDRKIIKFNDEIKVLVNEYVNDLSGFSKLNQYSLNLYQDKQKTQDAWLQNYYCKIE